MHLVFLYFFKMKRGGCFVKKKIALVVMLSLLVSFVPVASEAIPAVKCPDVSNDGIIDKGDYHFIEGMMGNQEQALMYFRGLDLNADNVIDITDIVIAAQYDGMKRSEIESCGGKKTTAAKQEETKTPSKPLFKCPDVQNDGMITVEDAAAIQALFGADENVLQYFKGADLNEREIFE